MEKIKITLEEFEKVIEVGSCSKSASGSLYLLSKLNFLKAYGNLVHIKYQYRWEDIHLKHIIDKLVWLIEKEDNILIEEFLEELIGCYIEEKRIDILNRLMDLDLLAFIKIFLIDFTVYARKIMREWKSC